MREDKVTQFFVKLMLNDEDELILAERIDISPLPCTYDEANNWWKIRKNVLAVVKFKENIFLISFALWENYAIVLRI